MVKSSHCEDPNGKNRKNGTGQRHFSLTHPGADRWLGGAFRLNADRKPERRSDRESVTRGNSE